MAPAKSTYSFDVDVSLDDIRSFAELSGDRNPLHTDPDYAKKTSYGRQVLHGAFSAGLVSRMAGMHLPGRACLLHGLRLRFLAPIFPPAALKVTGRQISAGTVEVSITDRETARLYVSASYDFGIHENAKAGAAPLAVSRSAKGDGVVLVTGATGALGSALLALLGKRGLGLSRSGKEGMAVTGNRDDLLAKLEGRPVAGILHAGWPLPDNARALGGDDPDAAVEQQVAGPLREILFLGRSLAEFGKPGASLILVGSTASGPGRHNFRAPLYSVAKSMIPTLTRILALELAASKQRCAAVVFDILDGGMNKSLSPSQKQMQMDRVPSGHLANPKEAAEQILWVLENESALISGATISLSGGAMP